MERQVHEMKSNKMLKGIAALTLALVLALGMMLPAFAEDTIKIGVIGPLTGAYAQYGMAVANTAALTIEEVNAQGGVQFELLAPQDDQGDPELGMNAYNVLMDNGMDILLGCVTSGSCIAVATVAAEENLFVLTPSASNDLVPECGDQTFQICFTDSSQGDASARWIASHRPGVKVGIIYNNALDYSMGIRQSFVNTAAELGIEIVAEAAFSDDTAADFSVQVAAMKNAGAEFVFLPIYYTPALTILNQAKDADYAPSFFGVDGMDGVLGVEGLDLSLVEGVYMLTPFDATATDEKTVNFVTKYTAAYGADTLNQFGADAYDGVYVLKAAIEAAGITADDDTAAICEKLVAVMPALTYTGVTGEMAWSTNGTVTKLPAAIMIHDGIYVSAE